MSGDLSDEFRDMSGRIPNVNRTVGVFLEQVGNLASVEIQGERIKIPMVGYQPAPGTPVWVESQNGRLVCTGSSYQLSPFGTVVSSSAQLVRVTVDGGPTLDLPFRAGLTLTAGQRVEINPVTRVVQGVLSVVPANNVDPGGSGTSTPFADLLVQAVDSGATNGGPWWANDVYAVSSTAGGWFYGGALQAALRGVTSFSRIEIYLPLRSDLAYMRPPVGVHAFAAKPGSGFLSFSAFHTTGALAGWQTLPTTWGPAFRDGAAGLGFATHPNAGAVWVGRNGDAMSGALRFSGSR